MSIIKAFEWKCFPINCLDKLLVCHNEFVNYNPSHQLLNFDKEPSERVHCTYSNASINRVGVAVKLN